MTKKPVSKWKPIMLPAELLTELERFSETNVSKKLGFTNKSQLAAFAVREFLRNYSSYMAFLELVDIDSNRVLLIDHKLDSTVEVMVKGKKIVCLEHESDDCDHVKFAWLIPRFYNTLRKEGFKVPV